MIKIDLKEIINPLILLPIILTILFLSGLKNFNLVMYSFTVYFIFSFINNIYLVIKKVVKKNYYLFVYIELSLSLTLLIILFYSINLNKPILTSFFIVGLTDFLIAAYYNIMPRKAGKDITNLWKNKLIKSERAWFHPISAQTYIFKDFKIEIYEPAQLNPSNYFSNYYYHLFKKRLNKKTLKHQFKHKNAIAFQMHLDKKVLSNLTPYTHNAQNKEHKKSLTKDSLLLSNLKKINKDIFKNIITAYPWNGKCRIIFKKEYILKNPKRIYNFLKKIANSKP